MTVATVKRCYRCGDECAQDEFARDASKASGYKSICKLCDNAKSRSYYARNRDKVLARVKTTRVPRRCVSCGEPFMGHGRQRYCNPSCRPTTDSGATVEAVCEYCGRDFDARTRDRKRGAGRFCGKPCALRARSSPSRAAA